MINLTGMNGKELILNDEKIEKIEEVPEDSYNAYKRQQVYCWREYRWGYK